MSRTCTLNVPQIYQGNPPPAFDCPWLPRGTNPLGSSALGSTVSGVDIGALPQALDLGFTLASIEPG